MGMCLGKFRRRRGSHESTSTARSKQHKRGSNTSSSVVNNFHPINWHHAKKHSTCSMAHVEHCAEKVRQLNANPSFTDSTPYPTCCSAYQLAGSNCNLSSPIQPIQYRRHSSILTTPNNNSCCTSPAMTPKFHHHRPDSQCSSQDDNAHDRWHYTDSEVKVLRSTFDHSLRRNRNEIALRLHDRILNLIDFGKAVGNQMSVGDHYNSIRIGQMVLSSIEGCLSRLHSASRLQMMISRLKTDQANRHFISGKMLAVLVKTSEPILVQRILEDCRDNATRKHVRQCWDKFLSNLVALLASSI